MANPEGIGYDSIILNAKQEKAIEKMSEAIMKYGAPTHGDMLNDPVIPANSIFEFVNTWQIIFPEIGQKVSALNKYAFSPKWRGLTSLSSLLGGIRFVMFRGEIAPEFLEALGKFEDVLVEEANQVGSGNQKEIAERDEVQEDPQSVYPKN